MTTLDLGGGVTFTVDRQRHEVWTTFPCGGAQAAQRPDTPENRAEAAWQGYRGVAAVWRSLLDHELLHSLVSRIVFGTESLVLRHEAGIADAPYACRLHEEAIVLSVQRWICTGEVLPAFGPYVARAPALRAELRALTDSIGAA